jgi:hypothetical protein
MTVALLMFDGIVTKIVNSNKLAQRIVCYIVFDTWALAKQ